MNLEKEMKEYVLKEVSVWNNDGNREKFLPQQEYLNLCEAISIAEEYAEERCRAQRENILTDAIFDLLQNDPHGWSRRPCSTCRSITSIIGRPFGCYEYQRTFSAPSPTEEK